MYLSECLGLFWVPGIGRWKMAYPIRNLQSALALELGEHKSRSIS